MITAQVSPLELGVGKGIADGKHFVLLGEANEIEVAVVCNTVQVLEAEIEAEGKGKMAFKNCVTYTREPKKGKENYSLSAACEPEEQPITAGGLLQVIKVSGGVPIVRRKAPKACS